MEETVEKAVAKVDMVVEMVDKVVKEKTRQSMPNCHPSKSNRNHTTKNYNNNLNNEDLHLCKLNFHRKLNFQSEISILNIASHMFWDRCYTHNHMLLH